MNLLKEVLEEIKPDEELKTEVSGKIYSVLSALKKKVKEAKVILGGSGAKGTWLKRANDADIFVCFKYSKYKDKSDQLSGILEKKLKKIFPRITKLHGSRDYFQLKKGNFTFEIVPILDIKDAKQAVNITDVSPLHAKWVAANTNKALKDEIRLTKQFCKANNAYGAESYIRGFSGYICEVLTTHYGSFLKLARNAAKWPDKVIIDIKKYYKGKDVLQELNKSKAYSPLILIDPVQHDRNAAAALSKEKFDNFRLACKNFLKKPSKELFKEKVLTTDDLKKKAKNKKLIALDIKTIRRKEDIAGAKLVKSFEYMADKLLRNDFKILEKGWHWDKELKATIFFICDKKPLPNIKLHEGPALKQKFHVKRFKAKHKNTFTKGKKVFAKVKREFTKPEDLVKKLIKEPYIKEKVKQIRLL
ncbi:CCA tRNA nucleotidyltransferase [Candidatus Woesearchaeota archaeon]|nr:CCA tRNA nucleotidyltransferase [Candidatus Woesearchaeota archaeon]